MGDQRATTTTASFCGVETDECTDTTSNPCCDDYECTGYSPFYKSCTLKQDATCLGRWADCTNSIGGCCGGLDCVGNQFYRQCQKQTCGVDTDRCGDDSGTTFYSSSNNDNECCGDYECVGNEYYKSCQLKAGATCLPRWGDCTNDVDGCCDGLQCVGNQYYRSCTKN